MTPSELVRRLFDAFNAHDVEGIAARYHSDAELWLAGINTPPGTVFHGREGLRSLLREVLPRAGPMRAEIVKLREVDDAVVATTHAHSDNGDATSCLLFRIEDGLVKRVEEFATEAEALAAAVRPHVLTPREREVFELLARGRSGPQIAAELVLSPETVRTHVQNGIERLGARTRVHAVAVALESGEISI